MQGGGIETFARLRGAHLAKVRHTTWCLRHCAEVFPDISARGLPSTRPGTAAISLASPLPARTAPHERGVEVVVYPPEVGTPPLCGLKIKHNASHGVCDLSKLALRYLDVLVGIARRMPQKLFTFTLLVAGVVNDCGYGTTESVWPSEAR